MDFITDLLLTQQGHDSIWVIVDRLTKSAHFVPVNTTYLSGKYTKLYVSQIMKLHGVPRTIVLDQGPQFIARFWEHLHQAVRKMDPWPIYFGFWCFMINTTTLD